MQENSRNEASRIIMKEIPLTQGKFAIIDDEDYNEINKYKWYYRK